MTSETLITQESKGLGFFEKYLTLWIFLCIIGGIMLGKVAPQAARYLDGLAIYSNGAPVISIPIAICLFFMMFPIMVKIDFAEVIKAGKSVKPVLLTLIVNWAIKPFTMYAIALLFLGTGNADACKNLSCDEIMVSGRKKNVTMPAEIEPYALRICPKYVFPFPAKPLHHFLKILYSR